MAYSDYHLIISIVLPCLVELLMEWVVLHDHGRIPDISYFSIYAIFAIYAGVVGYFRGKRIWHKLVLFVVDFFVTECCVFFVLCLSAQTDAVRILTKARKRSFK
jgi:hypothetical protein